MGYLVPDHHVSKVILHLAFFKGLESFEKVP